MTDLTDAPILSLAAMARRCGVPQRWLRLEAAAGRIPHLRAGARLLFNAGTVVAALAARAAAPCAEELPDPEGVARAPEGGRP